METASAGGILRLRVRRAFWFLGKVGGSERLAIGLSHNPSAQATMGYIRYSYRP